MTLIFKESESFKKKMLKFKINDFELPIAATYQKLPLLKTICTLLSSFEQSCEIFDFIREHLVRSIDIFTVACKYFIEASRETL
jgi:hypothetical protein